MVNNGPSTGCQKCRERHTTCDKTKPACRRCIARGYICPGYRDFCGIVFKDESRSVFARQSRRTRTKTLQRDTALPSELKLDPATIAIPFFFQTQVLAPEQASLTSRGHFDHLATMYSKSGPFSPLALATVATATRAMTSHLHLQQNSTWHLKNDSAANQAIIDAIADPEESLRDETLLAVLALEFGTHFSQTDTVNAPSRAHLDGALALVHHRGARNFATTASSSLFGAVRSNVLLQALWYGDQRSTDAILSFPDIYAGVVNPVMHFHYILLKVLKWDSLRLAQMRSVDDDGYQYHVMARLQAAETLQADLDAWIHGLPWEWTCMFEQFLSSESWPDSSIVDRIPFFHVASLLGQWLCTKFMVLKLGFATRPWQHIPNSGPDMQKHKEITLEAQAVVENVCRLLAHLREGSSWHPPCDELIKVGMNSIELPVPEAACIVSLNMTGWLINELEEEVHGYERLEIASDTLERLSNEQQKASATLKDASPYSRTASNIRFF